MQTRWEWRAGDYDEGIVLEADQQRALFWGEYHDWSGPRFAIPGGGRYVSFGELLANGGRDAPEAVRAEVIAAVSALLRSMPPQK